MSPDLPDIVYGFTYSFLWIYQPSSAIYLPLSLIYLPSRFFLSIVFQIFGKNRMKIRKKSQSDHKVITLCKTSPNLTCCLRIYLHFLQYSLYLNFFILILFQIFGKNGLKIRKNNKVFTYDV